LFEANVTVAPIRHESGEIGGFSAIVRDLTKVRDYERRFRSVVESAPIAMIVVDGRGNIVLINRLTRSLFGYTQAELVGDSVEKLIPVRFSSQH
ncbi:PAS domain S-box protein, partial [Vibrio parahaemolyticus]